MGERNQKSELESGVEKAWKDIGGNQEDILGP